MLLLALLLDLLDASGVRRQLSEQRGVVVVNFWATWCEPCREELPTLEKLRTLRPSLVVWGVQMGGSARTAQDTAESLHIGFPLLLDRDDSVTKAWGVTTLPTTFVLRDGKVVFQHAGAVDWSSREWLRRIDSRSGRSGSSRLSTAPRPRCAGSSCSGPRGDRRR